MQFLWFKKSCAKHEINFLSSLLGHTGVICNDNDNKCFAYYCKYIALYYVVYTLLCCINCIALLCMHGIVWKVPDTNKGFFFPFVRLVKKCIFPLQNIIIKICSSAL